MSQLIKWPRHLELSLRHNQHKNYYETVQEAIDSGDHGYKPDDWVSSDQMTCAIATNECWTLQWYPDTPVGFCLLSAADLDVLLEAVNVREEA